jgi:hypothetical protein
MRGSLGIGLYKGDAIGFSKELAELFSNVVVLGQSNELIQTVCDK